MQTTRQNIKRRENIKHRQHKTKTQTKTIMKTMKQLKIKYNIRKIKINNNKFKKKAINKCEIN